jgi:hypothetical protein
MGEFEREAERAGRLGMVGEFWHFLAQSRKWWLLPVIVALVAFGVLVFLSSTGAAPFIYTLF